MVWPAGCKGQVQGADTKARHRLGSFRLHHGPHQHSLTTREASSWPGATAWLPGVASVACQQHFSPHAAPHAHPGLHVEGFPQGPLGPGWPE